MPKNGGGVGVEAFARHIPVLSLYGSTPPPGCRRLPSERMYVCVCGGGSGLVYPTE